ncbi:MAG: 4Fe-4S binding protein [Acidobacteriota bacterium]
MAETPHKLVGFWRFTSVRIISQAFFFLLFLFLCFMTWFSRLGGYPVSLFLEMDPLVSLANAISTHTIYRHLSWSLWILVPTILLGRFFCGWICPYGALHHFVGWLFNLRFAKDRIGSNGYRPIYGLKYAMLVVFLVLALAGALQTGLLDPICMVYRTVAVAVAPATDLLVEGATRWLGDHGMAPAWLVRLSFSPGAAEQRVFKGAWFVGAIIIALVAANLLIPRFFCRVLCPLGALLGWFSRFSLARIERDLTRCTDCNLCMAHCEGASDPQAALRKSECFVCFNCVDDCPEDALSYRFAPGLRPAQSGAQLISKIPEKELKDPAFSRRKLVFSGLIGLFSYPFLRLSAAVNRRGFSDKMVRPPGSVSEPEFLERCIKCDQCLKVCPTNVLQPAGLVEGGFECAWTPVMNMRIGFCQLNCVLCSEVCPTGAIQKISIERKLGSGKHAGDGPIVIGTAFFDQGRCLPWAMETPCVVCQEVCPVSPKAIGTYDEEIRRWDGAVIVLNKPYVRPELCIGCGICEHECPVVDRPAVYVTPVGETRSKERSLLLKTRPGAR